MEEVPFEDRHVPRVEIDWERSAWWWYPLTRSIGPAMRMNSLAVGVIAILLSSAGLQLGQRWFQPDWKPVWHLSDPSDTTSLPKLVRWAMEVGQSLLSFERMGLKELGFLTFLLLWLTMSFALLGGVLARRSLVELGQRTVSAWGEALFIVGSRWQSYLWSMGMHFVAVAGLLIPFFLLGLVSRLGPPGANISGVLLLLCFPLVFALGRFALSAIVCFPLSVCAIAAEKKGDAFEGFSRSNAYFFQRPVLVVLCAACLLPIGWVGEQLLFWTLTSGWWLMRGAFELTGGRLSSAAQAYIDVGHWLAEILLVAYWFSFFWSAAAAIYLIARKSVDSVELDELDSLESATERSLPDIPTTPPPPTEKSPPVEPQQN